MNKFTDLMFYCVPSSLLISMFQGYLTPSQLQAIPELAINPLAARLLNRFGNVNFKDFCVLLSHFSKNATREDQIHFIFNTFDSDGDGKVNINIIVCDERGRMPRIWHDLVYMHYVSHFLLRLKVESERNACIPRTGDKSRSPTNDGAIDWKKLDRKRKRGACR